jgi:two-component system, cell cycle response regulator DivK
VEVRSGNSSPGARLFAPSSLAASRDSDEIPPPPVRGDGGRPLVLLVYDDPDASQMYGQYLRAHGFLTMVATHGREGVDVAELLPPDLIVMDLAMPPLDGWEATRELKRGALTRQIPIIVCTGHVLGSSVERAFDAGCDGYLTKPCLPADLLAEIHRVLPPGA